MRLLVHNQIRSCANRDRDHAHADQFGKRLAESRVEDHLKTDAPHVVCAFAESLTFLFFHRECLDRKDVAQRFEHDFMESSVAADNRSSNGSYFSVEVINNQDEKRSKHYG